MWLFAGCTASDPDPGHTSTDAPLVVPTADTGSAAAHSSAPAPHSAAHSGSPHSAADEHTGVPWTGLYPRAPHDCAAGVPSPPFAWRSLPGILSTEDLAFTPDGWMVSANFFQDLFRYRRDGTVEAWVPDAGESRGLDVLPDGDLVFSNPDLGTLHRVSSAGSVTLLASVGGQASGIDVAADGTVTVGDLNGTVHVVDGATGAVTGWGRVSLQLYGTAFSVDERRIFFASYSRSDPRIYVTDRAVDGTWPAPVPWTTWSATGLAGLATDACDNVYAMDAFTCTLWRFAPDGSEERLLDLPLRGAYCPALAFGRGLGGWGADQLYVSTYDEVVEVDVGVPGRPR